MGLTGFTIATPVEIVLGAAAFAAITIPKGIVFNSFAAKTRANTAWYISDLLAGTTYITIGGGEVFIYNFGTLYQGGADVIIGYAKDSVGAATLEVILGFAK